MTKTAFLYTNDSDEGQVASGAPEPLPTIISDNEDSELHKTLAVSKGKPLDNDVINISSPSLDLSMQHHSSAGNKWKQLAKEPACSTKKLKTSKSAGKVAANRGGARKGRWGREEVDPF